MNSLIERFNKTLLFFIIYTIIFIVFFGTLGYTIPFVLALILAYILQKPTKYLSNKFHIKNTISALITTIVFYTIIISLLILVFTSIATEAIQLGKSAQSYVAQNTSYINSIIDGAQKFYTNLDPTIVSTIDKNISSFTTKAINTTVNISGKLVSGVLDFITSIPSIIMILLFSLLSTYFFTKDMTNAKNKLLNMIPQKNTDRLVFIFEEIKRMITNYLLSYMIIIGITFIETLIGFLAFKVNYAVILSLVAAFCDILPIIGIGVIYIPLGVFYLLSGNYVVGFGIIILYAVVSIIRQIIEPKIVSSTLGLHPVAVLAALFIGLKANGVSGMFFCIFLVLFYNILRKLKII
ncbi:MAG: sporulation integral membrane protein YtvI [Bacillota bacterium]|nr:sporulation integral membrane protein YtvI [Bacillota bacterium]